MKNVETRTLLARNQSSIVEICERGVLHVQVGSTALHLSRKQSEELATSLAIAMVQKEKNTPSPRLIHSVESLENV